MKAAGVANEPAPAAQCRFYGVEIQPELFHRFLIDIGVFQLQTGPGQSCGTDLACCECLQQMPIPAKLAHRRMQRLSLLIRQ